MRLRFVAGPRPLHGGIAGEKERRPDASLSSFR